MHKLGRPTEGFSRRGKVRLFADVSDRDPVLWCIQCDKPIPVSGVSGRNGKHEPLCEACCMGMERERFEGEGGRSE